MIGKRNLKVLLCFAASPSRGGLVDDIAGQTSGVANQLSVSCSVSSSLVLRREIEPCLKKKRQVPFPRTCYHLVASV